MGVKLMTREETELALNAIAQGLPSPDFSAFYWDTLKSMYLKLETAVSATLDQTDQSNILAEMKKVAREVSTTRHLSKKEAQDVLQLSSRLVKLTPEFPGIREEVRRSLFALIFLARWWEHKSLNSKLLDIVRALDTSECSQDTTEVVE